MSLPGERRPSINRLTAPRLFEELTRLTAAPQYRRQPGRSKVSPQAHAVDTNTNKRCDWQGISKHLFQRTGTAYRNERALYFIVGDPDKTESTCLLSKQVVRNQPFPPPGSNFKHQ